jgi:hypothetical protein
LVKVFIVDNNSSLGED